MKQCYLYTIIAFIHIFNFTYFIFSVFILVQVHFYHFKMEARPDISVHFLQALFLPKITVWRKTNLHSHALAIQFQ